MESLLCVTLDCDPDHTASCQCEEEIVALRRSVWLANVRPDILLERAFLKMITNATEFNLVTLNLVNTRNRKAFGQRGKNLQLPRNDCSFFFFFHRAVLVKVKPLSILVNPINICLEDQCSRNGPRCVLLKWSCAVRVPASGLIAEMPRCFVEDKGR